MIRTLFLVLLIAVMLPILATEPAIAKLGPASAVSFHIGGIARAAGHATATSFWRTSSKSTVAKGRAKLKAKAKPKPTPGDAVYRAITIENGYSPPRRKPSIRQR